MTFESATKKINKNYSICQGILTKHIFYAILKRCSNAKLEQLRNSTLTKGNKMFKIFGRTAVVVSMCIIMTAAVGSVMVSTFYTGMLLSGDDKEVAIQKAQEISYGSAGLFICLGGIMALAGVQKRYLAGYAVANALFWIGFVEVTVSTFGRTNHAIWLCSTHLLLLSISWASLSVVAHRKYVADTQTAK